MSYYEALLEKRGIVLDIATRHARQALETEERKKIRRAVPMAAKRSIDPITGYRICSSCHTPKPPEDYTTDRKHYDGCDARCKVCKRQLAAQYRKK